MLSFHLCPESKWGELVLGKTVTALSQPLHQVHRLSYTVGTFNPMRVARTI